MNQYAVELHSHTNHSDGDFTVDELHQQALEYGYDGLILTDHNTASGYKELEERAEESRLVTLGGIEWTTYFGHMLVHDAKRLVDWRTAKPDTIDQHILEVKEAGGLVGIAHPYAVGSPMCTGCHWSFNVTNWDNVDYIEVWNSVSPDDQYWSWDAYSLWAGLLDRGTRISCSAGRDWHRKEPMEENPAITYVETEGPLIKSSFRGALEQGAFYITLGPSLDWAIEQNGRYVRMGETLKAGQGQLQLSVLPVMNKTLRKFAPKVERVKVIHNGKVCVDEQVEEETVSVPLELAPGYVRVELWGTIKGKSNELLTISNPIYID
ncbi:CehA/McbA family metallohydrolase [Atopococcus tabaci]|uniref:CehA/McbA family metallohydrolase n=1 Tax=Atopococcus tabaci TaxID=269774 RepID=UPI0004152523|nr:CehA/McbA family metallohydrolase [Atopococcus tabaci]